MAYSIDKLVIEHSGGGSGWGHGQSHWTVTGFDMVEDAEEYVSARCNDLYGYSASGRVTKDDDGRIVAHMSCWNSCD